MEIDGHKPPDAFTWKMNDTEHMVVCKEEVSPEQERSPGLVKEEPEPPHIKEEEEELLERPEESDESMLLAVKREEDDEEDISSHCSAVEIEVELESDTSDNDVTEDSDEWEETSGGDISLSPVASNSPAANSQHPQRDEPSTSLLANMNPAAVVLHKHPLNMVHQALHPPAPLQQCSSDEEENVNHSYTWWEPKDDSGNNSDWSYSRSKSRSKEKKDKQKKSRKLNKDDTSKTKGMRSQTQVISCSECPEAFTSQVLLHEHIKQSHNDLYCQVWRNEPVTAAAFERITNSVTSQKQGDPDEQRSYSHQQFNWTLTQPEELKTHTDSLNHTGKKTHKCEHCDKSFVRAFDLKTHQVVHTGEKKFQCKDCDKSFSQSGGLRRHQRVHTGEKPFRCENCDKNFGRLFDLKRHHQLIHTGEKYLHCEHCDKTFNLLSSLTKHLRVHTGEKPYHCRHCDKSFTQSCNLRSHERVHTEGKPIHCKHCDKSFSRSGYLKKHQHVHTGEKHFNSKHCDKSFNQSNDFDIHQCTHTAEKNIM